MVDAKKLLEILWPDGDSRPSLRWLRELQALRKIPYTKIGGRVFFEPARCRASLRSQFEVAPA
jgi:hypothetical protein